jgi:hypothetical protein
MTTGVYNADHTKGDERPPARPGEATGPVVFQAGGVKIRPHHQVERRRV